MCAVAFCKGVILCNLIFAPIHGSSKSEINVTCVHSTEDDNELELYHTYLGERRHSILKRSFDQRLRIHVHYDSDTVSKLPASKSDLLKDVLIPAATEYFQSVLTVRRLNVPVTVARSCIRRKIALFRDDPRHYCMLGCNTDTRCGSVIVPQRHLQACRLSDGVTRSSEGQDGPGVTNTDFLLYVSTRLNDLCRGGTFAFASVCQLEAIHDRPVVGFINICPNRIDLGMQARAFMIHLIKHEIIHTLGLLPNLFAFFRDVDGNPLTPRNDITNRPPTSKGRYVAGERVIRRIVRRSWKVRTGLVSRTLTMLVTENVKREVRRHFSCPLLEGAELEDQDVQSSGAGSHWEKRLFENEAMTGYVSQTPVYSRITLALLHDTGWYSVDYDKADVLYWGRGLGCEFAMTSCFEYMERQHARNASILPYCDAISHGGVTQSRCSPDRKALVRCNVKKYSKNIPTRYQNFNNLTGVAPSDIARIGGMVEYADYCPYWMVFTRSTRRGKKLGSDCTVANNQPDNNLLLEHYGAHSVCLRHSTTWRIQNGTARLKPRFTGSGCYKYQCDMNTPGRLFIYVSHKRFVCVEDGQVLAINVHVNGTVVNGTIICPPYLQICGETTTRNRITATTSINSKDNNYSHLESVTSKIIKNGSIIDEPEEEIIIVSSALVSSCQWFVVLALLAAIMGTRHRVHACV